MNRRYMVQYTGKLLFSPAPECGNCQPAGNTPDFYKFRLTVKLKFDRLPIAGKNDFLPLIRKKSKFCPCFKPVRKRTLQIIRRMTGILQLQKSLHNTQAESIEITGGADLFKQYLIFSDIRRSDFKGYFKTVPRRQKSIG